MALEDLSTDELLALRASMTGRSAINPDQNTNAASDVLTGLKSGAWQLASAIPNVGDIVPGALFNARPFNTLTESIGEATGFQPSRFAQEAQQEYSPAMQASQQRLADAKGFWGTIAEGITEPRAVSGMIAESLPMMAAGGVGGRALLAAGAVKSAPLAVGIGEGALSAGMQMESLADNPDVDPRTAALYAAATGAAVGAIGVGGATLAQRMKINDPELLVAGILPGTKTARQRAAALAEPVEEVVAPTMSRGARAAALGARMGAGAVGEGLLEEAPQSAVEAALANLAQGDPALEGVAEAAAQGALAGAGMGGLANIRRAGTPAGIKPNGEQVTQEEVEAAMLKAGLNIDPLTGPVLEGAVSKNAFDKLMNMPGDPLRNAQRLRQSMKDEFDSVIMEEVDYPGNGIGGKRATRLRDMLKKGEDTSQEAIDAIMKEKSMPLRMRKRVQETDHYQNLPETEAAAEAQAEAEAEVPRETPEAAPAEPVVDDGMDGPTEPTSQRPEPLSPEDNAVKKQRLDTMGVQLVEDEIEAADLEGIAEATPEDTGKRAAKATNFSDIPATPAADYLDKPADFKGNTGGITTRGVRGLVSMLNGYTIDKANSADKAAVKKAKILSKKKLKDMRSSMRKFYGSTGAPLKAVEKTNPELYTFLRDLPGVLEDYVVKNYDGRVLAGLQQRGTRLADEAGSVKLKEYLNRTLRAAEAESRAKGMSVLSKEARLNLRRLNIDYDPDTHASAENVDTLFSHMHNLTKEFDKKIQAISSDPRGTVLDTDVPPGSRGETLREKLEQEKNENYRQAIQAKSAKELIAGIGPGHGASIFALTQAIQNQFAKLEAAIGRPALLHAMRESKNMTSKTRKSLPGQKNERETSEAGLFSTLYANYRENEGDIDLRPSAREQRFTNEKEEYIRDTYRAKGKKGKDGKIIPGRKLPFKPVTIKGDGEVVRTEGQPESKLEEKIRLRGEKSKTKAPLGLLLESMAMSSFPSPITRLLAKRLIRIAKRSGYLDNITLVIHPDPVSNNGNVGEFIPSKANVKGNRIAPAELHLWTRGTSEMTILHEALHAVTVGTVSKWLNDPKSVSKSSAAALKSLEAMRKEAVSALKGQRDNTGKPLKGSLETILPEISGDVGLYEFITYAMTDKDMQDWMREHTLDAVTKRKLGVQGENLNWWQVFTAKFKAMLGIQGTSNTEAGHLLEVFADSTGTLLGSISAAATRADKMRVFFYEPKRVKEGRKPRGKQTFAQVADPTKQWGGDVDPVVVTQAVTNDAGVRASHRATNKAKEEQKREELATEESGKAERIIEAKKKKRATTSVTPRSKQRIGPRSATFIDRTEESIANGVTRFVSAGKYPTYRAFTDAMLKSAGEGLVKYTESEKWMAETIGTFLSKTVDSFGTHNSYRNATGAISGIFRGLSNDAWASQEILKSLTMEQQQALLDYLLTPDNPAALAKAEAKLKANIPDEGQQRTIILASKGLNELLSEAKAMGFVEPEDMDKTVGDFIKMDRGAYKIVTNVSYSQVRPPAGTENRVIFSADGDGKTSFVYKENTINKYGDQVDINKSTAGMKFFMGANDKGDLYAIEEGSDMSVWNDYGVAPLVDKDGNPAQKYPFSISNPRIDGQEFTFYRKVTVAERHAALRKELGEKGYARAQKAGKTAVVVTGLTRLAQEWGRNIQGRQLIASMVETNNDPDVVPKEAKWILDDWPKKADGVEDMDADKVITIKGDGEAQKSKTLRNKLRIPGNWANIEDSPENRKLFGDMAGKYVAGPVYSSMLDYYDTTPIINSTTFRASLTFWKKGKTVFSPIAHVNNISGNIVLAYYYDIPAENIIKAFKVVRHGLASEKWQKRNPLNAELAGLRQEMHDMGITLMQAKTADYDVAAEAAFSDWARGRVDGIRGLATAFNWIETIASKSTDAYSDQDNVFRLAMYMTQIQDNATAEQLASGNVGADVKEAAALRAERAFVDYRIHAPWIKAARETVTPFIAWPYRMFPMLMKVLITKPWKAANTMMAITALNSLAYSILGADGDEEEEERNMMPEWHKQGIAWMPWVPSNIRLPVGTGDNAYFWNISRAITLADMDQISGSGVPSMLMPGGPAAILMYAAAGYDPFTGKELSNGTEDTMGFLESRAEYIARGMLPGAVNSIRTAVKHQGETGPLGYDHSFWVDFAKILGVSSFQVNMPEAAFYKDISRKQAQRMFNTEISRTWRNELRQKSPDYEAAAETEIELQRRLTERLQELAGET